MRSRGFYANCDFGGGDGSPVKKSSTSSLRPLTLSPKPSSNMNVNANGKRKASVGGDGSGSPMSARGRGGGKRKRKASEVPYSDAPEMLDFGPLQHLPKVPRRMPLPRWEA